MIGKYRIITLCGSTRFKDAFMEAQKRLTLQGNIVISVGLFGHSGDNEVWEEMAEDTVTRTKEMLDDMHKRKIDLADEIYVINEGGYIGESTKSEIEYAISTGKEVRYLEEVKDDAKAEEPDKTEQECGNILSENEVATIKIKLGKSHRKESDWDVIKQLLSSHSILTAAPVIEDPQVPTVEGILFEDGAFIVFTNRDDCEKHLRRINRDDDKDDREFHISTMPFDAAVRIADEYGKDLYVDYQAEENTTCLVYLASSHMLQAVLLQNLSKI